MGKHSTDYAGCGIYALLNVIEGKIYIGKSKNIKSRFTAHREKFVSESSSNSMYKEPIDNFVFFVVYKMSEDEYNRFGLILEELYMVQAKEHFSLYNLHPYSPGSGVCYSLQDIFETKSTLNTAIKTTCGVRPASFILLSQRSRQEILSERESRE